MAATTSTNFASATTNVALEGLRDIKDPVAIPTGWEWLWWTLGALLLIALLIGLALWLFRRRKFVAGPPTIPAHVTARQQLADALALIDQPKPFVISVSDTLRWYLEQRFSFRAPERTTEEFLRELKKTELLLPDQKESLGEFLQRCDLVKFAKYEPAETELRQLHGVAVQLVTETEPMPEPGPDLNPDDNPQVPRPAP
jgi:hypothetical protein